MYFLIDSPSEASLIGTGSIMEAPGRSGNEAVTLGDKCYTVSPLARTVLPTTDAIVQIFEKKQSNQAET